MKKWTMELTFEVTGPVLDTELGNNLIPQIFPNGKDSQPNNVNSDTKYLLSQRNNTEISNSNKTRNYLNHTSTLHLAPQFPQATKNVENIKYPGLKSQN